MTHRIEIDIADEEGYDSRTKEWASRFGCRARLLQEVGPAGGNPLYEITGTEENLRRLFKEYTAQAYPSPTDAAEKLHLDDAVEADVRELFKPEPVAN